MTHILHFVMKKNLAFAVILLLILAACQHDNSVSQIRNFTDSTWQRFDFLNFDFQIETTDEPYDILVLLRTTEDFPSQALLINLVMNLPSGDERIREYKLEVKDKEGEMLGEKKAGYFERFISIRKQMKFNEPGLLKFEIENLMSKYFTPGVVEFGIVL